MRTEALTPKQLFQHYHKVYHDLVNIYCQARENNPFASFSEIARAIYRVGVLLEFWHDVALKQAQSRYFQEE